MAKAATEESSSLIDSFVEEATESRGRDVSPAQVIAARREIGQAARRLFAEGGDLRDPEARSAVVQAMQKGTGTSEADANRMVDGWITSMENARENLGQMKEAAAAKAREVAEQSADALAKAALWTFVGFLLGALAATFGGRTGARWEYSHTELAADPNFDPANRRAQPRVRTTAAGAGMA